MEKKEKSFTNPDDRSRYDFESKYPKGVNFEIWAEACFLILLLGGAFFILYNTWCGNLKIWLELSDVQYFTLKRYVYYSASGLMGGITFGIKFLYRAVARGYWHRDRRAWRILSPLIAMIIAFIIGVLIEGNFINGSSSNGGYNIAVGFLAGYFADEAVGKMYEVANVIFGRANNSNSIK